MANRSGQMCVKQWTLLYGKDDFFFPLLISLYYHNLSHFINDNSWVQEEKIKEETKYDLKIDRELLSAVISISKKIWKYFYSLHGSFPSACFVDLQEGYFGNINP